MEGRASNGASARFLFLTYLGPRGFPTVLTIGSRKLLLGSGSTCHPGSSWVLRLVI